MKNLLQLSLLSLICMIQIACTTNTKTELPVKFDSGNPSPYGMPSVEVVVQNEVIPLLFDTGASQADIALSPDVLKGLDIKYTGEETCSRSFNGMHCQKNFIIPEMKMGEITVKNIHGVVMPKLWGGNQEGMIVTPAIRNGVIGGKLLSQFNILLDYANSKIVLLPKDEDLSGYNLEDWYQTPFTDPFDSYLTIDGKEYRIGWDTGSVPSIIRAPSIKGQALTKCSMKQPYLCQERSEYFEAKNIKTSAGAAFPDANFSVTDRIPEQAPFDGLIGSNFYRDNKVLFDFSNHIIYIKPYES